MKLPSLILQLAKDKVDTAIAALDASWQEHSTKIHQRQPEGRPAASKASEATSAQNIGEAADAGPSSESGGLSVAKSSGVEPQDRRVDGEGPKLHSESP